MIKVNNQHNALYNFIKRSNASNFRHLQHIKNMQRERLITLLFDQLERNEISRLKRKSKATESSFLKQLI